MRWVSCFIIFLLFLSCSSTRKFVSHERDSTDVLTQSFDSIASHAATLVAKDSVRVVERTVLVMDTDGHVVRDSFFLHETRIVERNSTDTVFVAVRDTVERTKILMKSDSKEKVRINDAYFLLIFFVVAGLLVWFFKTKI